MAVFDRADLHLHKPMLRAGVANIIFTYGLVVIADVTALKTVVKWGYQFTIVCIESLLFVIAISIMEIVEYHKSKGAGQQGYFKVNAKAVGNGGNVFGANDDNSGLDDSEQP